MDSTTAPFTETQFLGVWNTTFSDPYGTTIVNQSNGSLDNFNATPTSATDTAVRSTVAIAFILLMAFVLMVSTVGGNLLVIIAYHKNRRLRSVNNLFLVSLACSDLVIGLVSMNLYPPYIIMGGWYLGEIACDIWLCIDYTLSMASVANLMLICLDRYFSVICPFKYRPKRTRVLAKVAIILAWLFSMLLWAPAIIIWPRTHPREAKEGECKIAFFTNSIITSVTAVIAFYLPVVIMIILYWRIYRETQRCREYMDYLRGYSTTSQKSKSPFINCKSKEKRDKSKPRGRLYSSPATSFTGVSSSKALKSEPLAECENEDDPNTSEENNLNNNCKTGDESGPGLTRFRRITRSLADSIRSSIKSSSNDCAVKVDSDITSGKSQPDDKQHRQPSYEIQSLLEPAGSNGVAGHSRKNKVVSTKTLAVPEITTSDHSDQRATRNARRAMSETDTSRLLSAPSSTKSRPESRSESTAGPSVVGPSKIPSAERKAARTLSAILLAFVLTWLPYNVCVVLDSFFPYVVPDAVWYFAYYLCYINSTLNPFCYAACNKNFRDTFARLLTCRRRGQPTPSLRCCWNRRGSRANETLTMQPSSSSSKSIPPSPSFFKRNSSNT